MKLSVPYIPDPFFLQYLGKKAPCLESVYFGLFEGPLLDGRVRFASISLKTLAKDLSSLSRVKKYLLLNTRFIHPALYRDEDFLSQTLDRIELLHESCGLEGLVFSDFFLIKGLDATGRDILSKLQAVPGINTMIDSFPKALSFWEAVAQTRFRHPEKILVDRGLNRSPKALEALVGEIKRADPCMGIELLANEGCLFQCPFKLTHDAQISLSNTGLVKEATFGLSQALGCHAEFYDRPWTFLKSPFIRPEDIHYYRGLADTIKICGRTLGTKFLIQCIEAYTSQSFEGNLLDLMDATRFLADHYHVNNKGLDPNFFKTVTNCTKNCKCCNLCPDLFLKTTRKKKLTLKSYKDYQ